MYGIVLCGGSGTRLWPLSRQNFPKQFLKLYSDKSLLQETFLRWREIVPSENVIFITNQENFFNVLNQIKEIDPNFDKRQVLVEPASLNTAPAVALGVKHIIENRKASFDESVFFSPADHYIADREKFINFFKSSAARVGDNIGTIGIIPTGPETCYGYIRKGEGQDGHFRVQEFKEKPDRMTAEKFVSSGEYFWNSGIYTFKIKTFLRELNKFSPAIYKSLPKTWKDFLIDFKNIPAVSFDVAVSEKSEKVIVFPGDFGWSDVGSFDALAEIAAGGDKKGREVMIDSENIFTFSSSGKLVAVLGVRDLAVVESGDSILVYKRGRSEEVKKIVEKLKAEERREVDHSLIVHRPWGKYEVLIEASAHKVKKITVYPGAKLSLQSHSHRAEHWVVVHGLAKVTINEKNFSLNENESTFIPAGAIHRLENPGKIDLEIIEVQTGRYLEEDDIARHEDVYNRVG